MFVPTQMFSGRCSPELLSLGADTLIIQTIMDLIESDWAEMSHGQLKFVEIWRDRCCDNKASNLGDIYSKDFVHYR